MVCDAAESHPSSVQSAISDVALRLWARLEGDAAIGRNSCERGQWGAEERGGGAPGEFQIARGREFELIILVTNSAYKVGVEIRLELSIAMLNRDY